VINSCLSLIGSRAFEYGELKKAMLQAVIIVITGNGAKYNEPVLFMRIMVREKGVWAMWLVHVCVWGGGVLRVGGPANGGFYGVTRAGLWHSMSGWGVQTVRVVSPCASHTHPRVYDLPLLHT
jgi:hypothetical protein